MESYVHALLSPIRCALHVYQSIRVQKDFITANAAKEQ